jgi:hypothetical protein
VGEGPSGQIGVHGAFAVGAVGILLLLLRLLRLLLQQRLLLLLLLRLQLGLEQFGLERGKALLVPAKWGNAARGRN